MTTYLVSPRHKGWAVRREGAVRAWRLFTTKGRAIAAAKERPDAIQIDVLWDDGLVSERWHWWPEPDEWLEQRLVRR